MTRSLGLLLGALVLLAVAPYPSGPAAASCAAPLLSNLDDVDLTRGATVTVEGRGFVDGCRDSMSCPAFGCGECEWNDPPPAPLSEVRLELRQQGRSWDLGVADADESGAISWTFVVPGDARPGRARLIGASRPTTVRLR